MYLRYFNGFSRSTAPSMPMCTTRMCRISATKVARIRYPTFEKASFKFSWLPMACAIKLSTAIGVTTITHCTSCTRVPSTSYMNPRYIVSRQCNERSRCWNTFDPEISPVCCGDITHVTHAWLSFREQNRTRGEGIKTWNRICSVTAPAAQGGLQHRESTATVVYYISYIALNGSNVGVLKWPRNAAKRKMRCVCITFMPPNETWGAYA